MNAELILAGQTIEIDSKEYEVTKSERLPGTRWVKLSLVAGSEARTLIMYPDKLVKVVA